MKRRALLLSILSAFVVLTGCAGGSGGSNMGGNITTTAKVLKQDGTPALYYRVELLQTGESAEVGQDGLVTFKISAALAQTAGITYEFFNPGGTSIGTQELGVVPPQVDSITSDFTITNEDTVVSNDVQVELQLEDPISPTKPDPENKPKPRDEDKDNDSTVEIPNTTSPGSTETGGPTSSEYQDQGEEEAAGEQPQGMGIEQKQPSNPRA